MFVRSLVFGATILIPCSAAALTPCPGVSPEFSGAGEAFAARNTTFPTPIDCDEDLDRLLITSPNYGSWVEQAVNGVFAECLALVSDIYVPTPADYGCVEKCSDGDECFSGVRSTFDDISLVAGHKDNDPYNPDQYSVCEPSLRELTPGAPNGQCFVTLDCDVSCSAEVTNKVICGCAGPHCGEDRHSEDTDDTTPTGTSEPPDTTTGQCIE